MVAVAYACIEENLWYHFLHSSTPPPHTKISFILLHILSLFFYFLYSYFLQHFFLHSFLYIITFPNFQFYALIFHLAKLFSRVRVSVCIGMRSMCVYLLFKQATFLCFLFVSSFLLSCPSLSLHLSTHIHTPFSFKFKRWFYSTNTYKKNQESWNLSTHSHVFLNIKKSVQTSPAFICVVTLFKKWVSSEQWLSNFKWVFKFLHRRHHHHVHIPMYNIYLKKLLEYIKKWGSKLITIFFY